MHKYVAFIYSEKESLLESRLVGQLVRPESGRTTPAFVHFQSSKLCMTLDHW